MASPELIRAFESYKTYTAKSDKADERVIDACVQAASVAYAGEKDIQYGKEISAFSHSLIDRWIFENTRGHIADLEYYCGVNDVTYNVMEKYYDLLRIESPFLVDSFFRYIEMDEKNPKKRFYWPRAKRLKPIISAYQDIYDGKLEFLSVSQPKRTGKCLVNSSKVCTPTGFKEIGQLKVGDYVIGANGNSTKVIGVYPQSEKKRIYEIEFSENGNTEQKTVIECCADHLWEVSTEDSRYKHKANRVLSTSEIMNGTLKRGKDHHNNYAVEYVMPVEFNEKYVPLNPWLLGVLIGDGSLCSNVGFSNMEKDIIERVTASVCAYGSKLNPIGNGKDYRISFGSVRAILQEIGLFGKKSDEKFVPDIYMYNSVSIRAEILRGLIDTDGYVDKNGIEYTTVSRVLADNVCFLVRSLGGKCACKIKHNHYTKDGKNYDAKDSYVISIAFPKHGIVPVSSEKHLKKYNPMREKLYHFVNDVRMTDRYADMTCIEVEDERALYVVSDRFILTHNTTSGLKLCQMMAGRSPEGSIFATGKGEGLVKRFYGGLLQTFENEDSYKRFLTVFPEAKKTKNYKSAENLSIDLKKENVFSTITCRPIDGAIVGCTEANVLVYIDDCVKNHEEARSRERLEFLCEKVTDDVLGRRLEGTPIIIQGTKYSLYDPITALQEKANLLGWRWREVAIPALDPVTDESNWEIEREGKKIFTTDYYRKERMLVTPETWAAEFQQEPYEAKGRLFPESELNRFERLPVDREPDAIMAACDTAKDGGDYCAMPIAYIYGNEVYIVDVVFDNSGSKHTIPECANKIIEHNVKTITFESNAAGSFFGKDVMDEVKKMGGRCSAKYKFNTANKITRMENAQLNILNDYYFLAKGQYAIGSQYDLFMKNVTTMTRSGKVKHDDAPDSLALLENEMRSGTTKPTVIMQSPI